ncbi:hypothetical protein ACWXV6_22380 [Pantoea ananatis]|uniref:hypothetical protein n=1 Tax=Pantoea ananas TaxID=553 RepID=UPI000D5ED976|nr:hypothetical protein [Pantoea ananatis]PVY80633.1 hypothetical protein C7427_11722 [Pantoea ananatis]
MSEFLSKIDANPPHWAGEKIGVWDDSRLRLHGGVLRRHYWTDAGSINVFCIKGTAHPDYQGISWHEFLHRGKRMDRNIPMLERNPGYYSETSVKKPSMYYNSYDGIDWYIGADGNHRSGLARFFFHEQEKAYLHGVHLNHYEFDEPLLAVYLALRDELALHRPLGLYAETGVSHVHLSRADNPGWKTDIYSSSLYFPSLDLGAELLSHPLVHWLKASGEIKQPAEGWQLLHELLRWRNAPAVKGRRQGLFSRLFR